MHHDEDLLGYFPFSFSGSQRRRAQAMAPSDSKSDQGRLVRPNPTPTKIGPYTIYALQCWYYSSCITSSLQVMILAPSTLIWEKLLEDATRGISVLPPSSYGSAICFSLERYVIAFSDQGIIYGNSKLIVMCHGHVMNVAEYWKLNMEQYE